MKTYLEFLGRFAIWEALQLTASRVFANELLYNWVYITLASIGIVWIYLPFVKENKKKC